MAKRDYYEVLGVQRDADDSSLKRAYRRLAMKYHPDRNPDDAQAEEKFKEATEAYGVLSNEEKRLAYDRFGHDGVNAQGGFSNGTGFGDIFGDLDSVFGSIFGQQQTRRTVQQGSDLRYNLEIDLEQAAHGDKVEIRVPALRTCDDCGGTGCQPGTSPIQCPDCGGTGQIRVSRSILMIQQTCPRCRGSGKIIASPCQTCFGEGRVEREKTLSLTIPVGVDNGTRLRVSGEGEAGPNGGPPGDLYVVFEVRPHPVFMREGNHLRCELPITFIQAALGAEVEVPTLTGKVKVNIPAETQTGKLFRLRGRGIEGLRDRRRGDLLCNVVVETPVRLKEHQKELFRELEETFEGSNSEHTPRSKSWFSKVTDFFDRITHD